jgi:outer membrane protein
MKKMCTICLPWILSIILPVVAGAETGTLTLDEAVSIGMRNSELVHAAQMDLEASQARYEETRAARLPSLRFSAGYSYLSTVPEFTLVLPSPMSEAVTLNPSISNNYQMRWTVQQPVFTGFRLERSEQAASLNVKAGREDVRSAEADLKYRIRTAYWNLYRARESRRVVNENLVQVQAHLNDVQNLLAQGMATRNEVLRVETQVSAARLMLIDADNGVRLAVMNMDNILGLPLEADVEQSTAPSPGGEQVPDLSDLTQKALDNRPEVRALELRQVVARTNIEVARAARYPQAFALANYSYARPNTRIFPLRDQFRSTWDVGVSLSFDVWNWRATDRQVELASAQSRKVADLLAHLKDSVRLEVNRVVLDLVRAKEKISVASVGVDQATENLRVTRERFDEGLVLNSDVLDAEVAMLQANLQYTNALVDVEVARAGLQKAIGE